MEIVVEARGPGVAVVHLTGRLDLHSFANLKQGLAAVVAAGHRRLVVDLGAISFIDSSGLIALVSGLRATHHAGGALRLARPNEQARLLLQLTSLLDTVFRPYETVALALDGL